MRKTRLLLWILFGCLTWAEAAPAQVMGRIVGPGATKLWIAIAPLAAEGDASELGDEFTKVLERNLTLSGYFKILDRDAHIEGPEPTDEGAIQFANWRVLGAQALVKGRVRASGDKIVVEAALFDVGQEKMLGGKRYDATRGELRRLGRRFADQVLEMLTGEPGPFDSAIAFISRRGGRSKELWVMSPDGFDLRQLTENRTINLAPSWKPNELSLLFTSYRDGNPTLYRLDVSGRRLEPVSALRGLNLGGKWSPDGSSIAISLEEGGNSEIFLLDPSGKPKSRITRGPAIDVSPAWSPDGRRIAFVSDRAGGPQIYVMNADGTDTKRVTFEGRYNTSPSWSPKGDRLVYVRQDGGFHIHVLDLKSNQGRRIASGEDPSFSPDGRYVVFSARRGGKPALVLTDVAGSHQVQLTTPAGDDTSPAWSSRLP